VYYIRLNDLLVTKRITEAIFYGENAGVSTLKGVELNVQYRPASRLRANVSANASDNRFAEFTSDGISYAGKHLPGIPRLHTTADLHAGILENLWLQATYTFTGSQYMDDVNSRQVDAWQTINLRADYSLHAGKRLRVHLIAAVQNLFDERYASMILINAPTFGGSAPRYYYPALPRNFLFTMKIQLI
jgi:iron complex outermembrane receptor protein